MAEHIEINKEAHLMIMIEIAVNLLFIGNIVECGDSLETIKTKVEALDCPDIIVYSAFYRANALYYDRRKAYEEFHIHGLQYLAYTPDTSIKAEDKVEWSIKMGMAVLLGRSIYNVGELVEKEILKSLVTTSYTWLYDLLLAMNNANVNEFIKAIEKHKAQIESVPDIKTNMDQIMIKIKILALLELIFKRQKEDRSIAFSVVAQTSEIKLEEVEWLLMKTMSLGLIRGEIDQIDQIVKVTWMKPRILDPQRIQIVKDTVDKWRYKVQDIPKDLEAKTEILGKP